MKITLSEYAGFCPGVRRADDAIREAISTRKNGELICTIGPLIHNATYIDALRSEGVTTVEAADIEAIVRSRHPMPTTVFIRTHGIENSVHDHLFKLRESFSSLSIRDMTCPFVKSIHKIALNETNDSTFFLLFCNPSHAESIGIMSYNFLWIRNAHYISPYAKYSGLYFCIKLKFPYMDTQMGVFLF